MSNDAESPSESPTPPVATGASEPAAPAASARPADVEAEIKELKESRLRIAADFENYRKRTRREIDDAREDGRGQVLKELLPVFDNLERAVSHAGTGADVLVEGVRMTLRQLYAALERFDIKPIEAKGKPFDPQQHEAIQQVDHAELAPGTVVDELQRGYSMGKRLLRPALVTVSRGKPAAESSEG